MMTTATCRSRSHLSFVMSATLASVLLIAIIAMTTTVCDAFNNAAVNVVVNFNNRPTTTTRTTTGLQFQKAPALAEAIKKSKEEEAEENSDNKKDNLMP